jgi:hypothetical protein
MPEGTGDPASGDRAYPERRRTTGAARFLYGALVAAAALAVAGGSGDTSAQIVVATVVSLCVYWLAHVYTDVIAVRLVAPGIALSATLCRAFRDEAAIVAGGVPPLAVFGIAALSGASTSLSAYLALGMTAAMLAAVGFLAGSRAGSSTGVRVAEATAAALLGALVATLKVLLH